MSPSGPTRRIAAVPKLGNDRSKADFESLSCLYFGQRCRETPPPSISAPGSGWCGGCVEARVAYLRRKTCHASITLVAFVVQWRDVSGYRQFQLRLARAIPDRRQRREALVG